MKQRIVNTILAIAILVNMGCTVSYSFSGASVNYALTKTVSVQYFNNMAAMVAPILSPTFTDALISKLNKETRLQFVSEDGDLTFAGEIIDYKSDPISISGNEQAVQNRLTIAVRVRVDNKAEPKYSIKDKVFSNYADYPSSKMLTSVESELVPQIVEKLVEDIFNAALSNW